MNTKTLTPRALSVIGQYLHFKYGSAVCSVPYFNNKTARNRAALRVEIGKGSPQEILDEIQAIGLKSHLEPDSLADESLKKLLVLNNIGIDCSGFAYYALNAESEETKKGGLSKHLSFANCSGIIGKIRCSLRPIENCDVRALAHDKNSHVIGLGEIKPGDMVTMLNILPNISGERDHVLVIDQVEYQNSMIHKIHYSHAAAYPEDGLYGSGIKQGTIEIMQPEKSIVEQKWIEGGKEGTDNQIFARAQKSKTEIRRLNWL